MLNLSNEGCAVVSGKRVQPATYLSMRIQLTEQDAPLEIELAAVRWVSGENFGLEFIRIRPDAQERLKRFVRTLELAPQLEPPAQ